MTAVDRSKLPAVLPDGVFHFPTLHRGRRYDIAERRELRRTTVNDTPEAMLLAA